MLALCSAAYMRRHRLVGAVGSLLAAAVLTLAVYNAVLDEDVVRIGEILPSLLPIGLLLLGGVLALRRASHA